MLGLWEKSGNLRKRKKVTVKKKQKDNNSNNIYYCNNQMQVQMPNEKSNCYCSKNTDMKSSLSFSSVIPSALQDYPRRIILGLCINLRRKQINTQNNNHHTINNQNSNQIAKEKRLQSALHSETLKFRRKDNVVVGDTDDVHRLWKNQNQYLNSKTKFDSPTSTPVHFQCQIDDSSSSSSPVHSFNNLNSSNNNLNPDLNDSNNNRNTMSDPNRNRIASSSLSPSTNTTCNREKRNEYEKVNCRVMMMMTSSQKRRRNKMDFIWRIMLVVLFYLLILVDSSAGCGPGRGAGRRRAPRKLTPLVFKQHVPNVPENMLSASGLSEGPISREHTRFKALVPNYNSDIIFKDEEGTGADRLMTQRCKEKLNTLAISVMNQWPGVRLRVIEGWNEGNVSDATRGPTDLLHNEGRAVDITTSDKDRSKYGMLARLAVEAGFDWVYYETRAHIHCSVKSDSSQLGRTGGCFSENSTVMTPGGRVSMSDVRPGDMVLSMDDKGQVKYSEVIMFLDRNKTETREFYSLTTGSGHTITLTPSHLLYRLSREEGEELSMTTAGGVGALRSREELLKAATITFSRSIEVGDWLIIVNEEERTTVLEKVVKMEAKFSTGVFAPLTKQGNVIVDGVLASCYAVIDDQSLAHWAFLPVRFVVNVYEGAGHLWKQFSRFISFSAPLDIRRGPTTVTSTMSSSPSSSSSTVSSSQKRHANENNEIVVEKRTISDTSSSSNRTHLKIEDQGVHWYASFLYTATKYFMPSNLLYDG